MTAPGRPLDGPSNRLLICMGISEDSLPPGALPAAGEDAQKVYERLKNNFGQSFLFRTPKTPGMATVTQSVQSQEAEGPVEVVHDEPLNLNVAGMKEAIDIALKGLEDDTLVVFYYAGHGLYKEDATLLVPYNPELDPEGEYSVVFELEYLLMHPIVLQRSAIRIACILDTCRVECTSPGPPYGETSRGPRAGDDQVPRDIAEARETCKEPGGKSGDSPKSNGVTRGGFQVDARSDYCYSEAGTVVKKPERVFAYACVLGSEAREDGNGGYFTQALLHLLDHGLCPTKKGVCLAEGEVNDLFRGVNGYLQQQFPGAASTFQESRHSADMFLFHRKWRCEQLEKWLSRALTHSKDSRDVERENEPDTETRVGLSLSGLGIRRLPAEIDCLRGLKHLWLQGNDLETLPTEIGTLSLLVTLVADDNRIKSLPEELAKCTELQTLRLRSNRMCTVAEWLLSFAPQLHLLDVSNNRLPLIATAALQEVTRPDGKLRCGNQHLTTE